TVRSRRRLPEFTTRNVSLRNVNVAKTDYNFPTATKRKINRQVGSIKVLLEEKRANISFPAILKLRMNSDRIGAGHKEPACANARLIWEAQANKWAQSEGGGAWRIEDFPFSKQF